MKTLEEKRNEFVSRLVDYEVDLEHLTNEENRSLKDLIKKGWDACQKEMEIKLKQYENQEEYNCHTTHHLACKCREEYFKRLEEKVAKMQKILDRILRGLDEGISTVPNSIPHEKLRQAIEDFGGKG